MRRHKRNLWKIGIVITSILLFFVLLPGIPVPPAKAQKEAPTAAPAGTAIAQATPTADATAIALNREQLLQQIAGQQHTWDNWLWSNAATILSSFLSTLVIVIGALVGLWRWRRDQHTEREKRAEERFQSVVTGLGDDKEGARVGAAILLRTFLRPDYELFYTQTFDLAVAHLRLPGTTRPSKDSTPLSPLTTLNQALIGVFKEAFPLARSLHTNNPQSLDATGIQLDHARLRETDLAHVWMPLASLRNVDLRKANLNEAYLRDTDFRKANLRRTDLRKADLIGARLDGADLSEANLEEAQLAYANLSKVKLNEVNLRAADLFKADLSSANIEDAYSLKETKLRGVKGLTKEQLEACKVKGAIIDEDPAPNTSQSTVVPSLPSQSNDAQAPSAQRNTLPPESGEMDKSSQV